MKHFLFVMLLALLAIAPLPLGSNRPLFWSGASFATGVLFILWGVNRYFSQERYPKIPLLDIAAYLFCFTIAWATLQTLSVMPAGLWHPLWADASIALGEELSGSVSVNKYKSTTALMRLTGYGALFWMTMRLTNSRKRSATLFLTIALAGFIYSIYGLVVHLGDYQTILWFDKWAYKKSLTSVFVNRNSFATYAGITLICSAAIFFKIMVKGVGSEPLNRRAIREALINLSTRGWFFFLAIFIILTAIYLTQSRAGLLCSLLGLSVFIVSLLASSARRSGFTLLAGGVIIALLVGVFFISGAGTMSRMDHIENSMVGRNQIYEMTIEAIEQKPLLGTGYGTYEEIIPMFANENMYGYIRKAHNTYLENSMELGVIAAFALFCSIGILALICFYGAKKRGEGAIYPSVGLGVTALIASHSLVDFSLQMPAIAMTYAAVMGASVAQSTDRSSRNSVRIRPRHRKKRRDGFTEKGLESK